MRLRGAAMVTTLAVSAAGASAMTVTAAVPAAASAAAVPAGVAATAPTARTLLPADVTVPPAASSARQPAITIRAIDREGRRVAVTAWLQSATRRVSKTLTSAHATRVPTGRYNVAALVKEPGGHARTLVDRGVTITGQRTLTFDARRGRELRFTIDGRKTALSAVEVGPFAPRTHNYALTTFGAPGSAGKVYLVPGKLPLGWNLYLQADLSPVNASGAPVGYAVIRVLHDSIPANPTFGSRTAKMASDHVTVRQTDPGASGNVGFKPIVHGLPQYATIGVHGYGRAPFSVTIHFTPGYRWPNCASWGANVCASELINHVPVFRRAHRYWQTFGSAVFSPSPQGGVSVDGTQMQGGVGTPFVDPKFTADSSGLYVASAQAWLYSGGKLLKHTHNGLVNVHIPYGTRWYRLRVVARRGARATLSKAVAVSYTFPAAAQRRQPEPGLVLAADHSIRAEPAERGTARIENHRVHLVRQLQIAGSRAQGHGVVIRRRREDLEIAASE